MPLFFSDFLTDLIFCLVSHVEHICVKLFIFYLIFKVAFDMAELKCLEDNNRVVPNCLFKCPEGYEESYIDPLLFLPLYKYSFQKKVYNSLSFLRNLARECVNRRKEAIENCQAQANDLIGMILQASQFDHDVNMEDLVDEFSIPYFFHCR